MDIGELLSFQPQKPSLKEGKRRADEDNGYGDDSEMAPPAKRAGLSEAEKERILQMVEDEPVAEAMDETTLKRMILQFEKKVYRNQEMRIKYPDMPEKFLESEVELNEVIQEMHAIATVPDLYYILVDLNAVQSLMQLLNHDNTDISVAVVNLLQEMTDVDTLTDSEEGAASLVDALMEGHAVALLIQNMERLDETVKEESDGVHNTLGIVENMTELRPETCVEAGQQGLLQWLFKRLKVKQFDANKLYCSEILAILLQSTEENRQLIGDQDGMDVLLQLLAPYKRYDPTSRDEIEMMENLFNCLCSALMLPANRDRFLKGEGVQLMNLMLRDKKMSRTSAIKVLNHAMTGAEGAENCGKFVDILGLRSIFPLFMKLPKQQKKVGPNQEELEEHVVSIIASLLKNCQSTQRQRLLTKFTENDHEKVDRLMELHFKYLEKVRRVDDKIAREKSQIKHSGGILDEEAEEQFYLQRLEAGLFTLQLTDYIMLEVCHTGASSVKQRVHQILNLRGGSVKTIVSIMREYAGNIGDAKDAASRDAEQNKILQLMDKFKNSASH